VRAKGQQNRLQSVFSGQTDRPAERNDADVVKRLLNGSKLEF
jgi:hypothetical protein